MKMSKLKLSVVRDSSHPISKGTAVVMSDGWRGKVHQFDGETVICIQDGERPNDRLRGYRAFPAAWWLTIDGHKCIVDWTARTAISKPTVDHGQRRSVVVDLVRSRLEREWESAPDA